MLRMKNPPKCKQSHDGAARKVHFPKSPFLVESGKWILLLSCFWVAQIGPRCRHSRQSPKNALQDGEAGKVQNHKETVQTIQSGGQNLEQKSKTTLKTFGILNMMRSPDVACQGIRKIQRTAGTWWLNTQKPNRGQLKLIRGNTQTGKKNNDRKCKKKKKKDK